MRRGWIVAVMLLAGLSVAGWKGQSQPRFPASENDAGRFHWICAPEVGLMVSVGPEALRPEDRDRDGLPPLERNALRDGIRNAIAISGDAGLIAAANRGISLKDLGERPIPEGLECACSRTNCWGQPSSCQVKYCSGLCGDCYTCTKTGPAPKRGEQPSIIE